MSESKNTSTASDDSGAGLGLKRRTILTGAAWTVPIMVAATTTPALAASNDLTLKFDKSSYSGQACGTITGAYVTATRNGAAAAGESVTVSLADGYTFSDGSTSSTGTTGSDGRYSLPDIKVPARGGDSTFTATSGQASTSASVSAGSNDKAYDYQSSIDRTDQSTNVPSGAVAKGWTVYLAENGDLYDKNTKIASGVKTAVGQINPANNGHLVSYTTSSGAYSYQSNGDGNGGPVTTQDTNVPAGATAVGWTDFLAQNGDLYDKNTKIATNVKTAAGAIDPTNNGHLVSYTAAPSC